MTGNSDIQLFEQIKKGSQSAFDTLFKKYYVILCKYVIKYTFSYDVAEETVQDVFVQLWDKKDKIIITNNVLNYLFTSVRNNALMRLRQDKSRLNRENLYADKDNTINYDYDNIESNEDKYTLIYSAITELPEKCREIFILSKVENLTYAQIAEKLNISQKTVDNQMGIAFKKLREMLLPVMNKIMLLIIFLIANNKL